MALTPIFFFGTLRHIPLLEIVLGRSRQAMQLSGGTLPDHAVNWVQDQPFPMISTAPKNEAAGLLYLAPTEEDVTRLNYYEGGFAYDLRDVTVVDQSGQSVAAQVFFPEAGQMQKGAPWDLAEWEQGWAAIIVEAAREAMENFGRWSAQDLATKLPMLRSRAATFVSARQRAATPDARPGAADVEVLSRKRVHSHFFALDHLVLRHPRYDGTMSDPLDREAFFAGQAVVVLPYDPVRDEVILIQQFRVNMYALGDPNPWVVEAVAGLIDPGETPREAALREAQEEAGVRAKRFELVSEAYSSTGSNTEFVTSFLALADFGELGQGGGLDTEGEDIRRMVMPFDEFANGLKSHRFRDAPLIAAGFWLMLNRDRLRGSA